nr:hypothetical protein [Phaeobacter gallaeciensis]
MPTRVAGPIRVLAHQSVIELGQLGGDLDVDRVFFGCLIAFLARSRQEKAKSVPDLVKTAMQGLSTDPLLGCHHLTIGGDQDGRLGRCGFLGVPQCLQGDIGHSGHSWRKVELLVDQDAAGLIRLIGRAIAQLSNSRLGDIRGLGKIEREFVSVERFVGDLFQGFEDLGGVHGKSVLDSSVLAKPKLTAWEISKCG